MFENKIFTPESEYKEETKEEKEEKREKITEQEIDKNIKENPRGFIGWFNTVTENLSEKVLKNNKVVRNAFIYSSVLFFILRAGEVGATKSEDVVSKFIKRPTVAEKIEKDIQIPQIKPEELTAVENKEHREILAENINSELRAFNGLSKSFNESFDKTVSEKPELFPSEIIDKTEKGEEVFDFAGRAYSKISESNSFFESISKLEDKHAKEEVRKKQVRKIFEDGRLNFKELAKTFPEGIGALYLSILTHELGHREEAIRQGAKSAKIKMGLSGGYVRYEGRIENRAAVSAAGIKASKKFGECLTDGLRDSDTPSQLLAMMALVAKSSGMLYSMRSVSDSGYRERGRNDITSYAKETNTPASQLALGLAADFIFDKDNWNLMKIILGKDGAKISRTTIAPMYELGDKGPMIGIKFKTVW